MAQYLMAPAALLDIDETQNNPENVCLKGAEGLNYGHLTSSADENTPGIKHF